VWLGEIPLQVEFWELFHICSDPKIEVAKCGKMSNEGKNFRRILDEQMLVEWVRLQD